MTKTPTAGDMKNCPFCGSAPDVRKGAVCCGNSSCHASDVFFYHAEWNTRAHQPKPTSGEVAEAVEWLRGQKESHEWGVRNGVRGGKDYDKIQARYETLIQAAQQCEVVEVTHEQLSTDIQVWKFSEESDGTFAGYLENKYPHGLRIVDAKNEDK